MDFSALDKDFSSWLFLSNPDMPTKKADLNMVLFECWKAAAERYGAVTEERIKKAELLGFAEGLNRIVAELKRVQKIHDKSDK